MLLLCLALAVCRCGALRVVVAGGTGGIGSALAEKLACAGASVTILCRNAFLTGTKSRVSEDFGWIGKERLDAWDAAGLGIELRDWTGGDLLDSVSNRWVGWEDSIVGADAIVFAAGDLGRDGRMRPLKALVDACAATDQAPQCFVLLAPVDELVLTLPHFAEKKVETLRICEAFAATALGPTATSLRFGRVLGLPKGANSRLFPAPRNAAAVKRQKWIHMDDLATTVQKIVFDGLDLPSPATLAPDAPPLAGVDFSRRSLADC